MGLSSSNATDTLSQRILQIEALKREHGIPVSSQGSAHQDLPRLKSMAVLIDSTWIFEELEQEGATLPVSLISFRYWKYVLKRLLIRSFFPLFKYFFRRQIQYNQELWVIAAEFEQMKSRIEILEKRLISKEEVTL
ncbi:MAG: hypothetical protein KA436_05260 [Oligoflexales bacterium]|nr:hypothetical protein [Oligoflexales bacterium]